MKINHILLAVLAMLCASCGEDRRKEYAERTAPDRWIEQEMRNMYYWYADMPEKNKLNYFTAPDEFFKKLLSKKDGKNSVAYSRIEQKTVADTRSSNSASYGFEYGIATSQTERTERYLLVMYTLPNSPATDAGLVRGDWIFKINGEAITEKNLAELLSGDAIELEVGYLDEELLPVPNEEPVQLAAAREVEDDPIHYVDIFEVGGKKVAYLVYNSFTSGRDESDADDVAYLSRLADLSNTFKSAGVNEFILDLRYNPGGELNRPVPLICSMLAPRAVMGSLMGYVEYNDKNIQRDWQLTFNEEHLMGGSNLGLLRTFIITTAATASASEAVINFLTPHMEVILVGAKSEGKNVGSQKIEDERYDWVMHPIVCKLYNALDESDYENGFSPRYEVSETSHLSGFLPFGNPNETLLSTVLSIISGEYSPEGGDTRSTATGKKIEMTGSSLARKSLPGAIIIGR